MNLDRCAEGVTRKGEFQPCDKVAIAMRYDAEGNVDYPVCARHTRAPMVPLTIVLDLATKESSA